MINQVKVKLPYPVRVGFFSINTKKTVWFSFDNLSMFLFQQDEKITDSNGMKEWNEKHGKFDLFVYATFYAAKSYAMHNRIKFDLNFKKFAIGLANLTENEMKELTGVWQRSHGYGHSDLPGKKKVTAKQSR